MPTIEELTAEVAALRRRVDASEDILQLQALKGRYGELLDGRYSGGSLVDQAALVDIADQVAALFTVDAIWDGGPQLGVAAGREAIASRLRTPTLTFARHLFVKPQIRVDGDRATARWDLLCPCRIADGSSYWMCGYEDDTYIRTGDTWLQQSMKLTTLFMSSVAKGWTRILA